MPTLILHAGLFQEFTSADRAISRLVDHGVSVDAISLVGSEFLPDPTVDVETIDGSPPERRLPGILTGGAVGGVLGGLTAVAGAAASGGGALLVAGTLLSGALGGSVAGGFVGAMVSRGLEPDVADLVDQALNEGAILVVVEENEAESRNAMIHSTMRDHGATLYPAAAS